MGWGGIYGGEKAEVFLPFLLGCQREVFPFHQREVAEFNTFFPVTAECLGNQRANNAKTIHEKQSFIFTELNEIFTSGMTLYFPLDNS